METLLLMIIIGAIAGWLTSALTRGSLAGMAANIIVGISGAFFGNWLVNQYGILNTETSLSGTILVSAVSALMLLSIMRMLRLLA